MNQKSTGRAMSIPEGLAVGGLASVITTILAAAVLAKLLDTEKIQWENVGYGIMGLIVLASALGTLTACGKIKRQYLAVSLLSGIVYFGVLMAITALFFGGQYEAVGVTALLVFGSCIAAGLLRLQGTKGHGRRKTSVPVVKLNKISR